MDRCSRLSIKLLVSDDKGYMRYISDHIPMLMDFSWKWQQFMSSIGHEFSIDTDTICKEIMGSRGKCFVELKKGDYGTYAVVNKYLA